MYLILVYDVNVLRVNKIMRLCRIYLNHIQNSVFEGEITLKNFKEFIQKIEEIINKEEDSIILFKLRKESVFNKEIIGLKKGETDYIINFEGSFSANRQKINEKNEEDL